MEEGPGDWEVVASVVAALVAVVMAEEATVGSGPRAGMSRHRQQQLPSHLHQRLRHHQRQRHASHKPR